MGSLEGELSLRFAQARIQNGNLLRHRSRGEMEVVHLGGPTAPLFAVFHRPSTPPVGVVVVCSPPYVEAVRNHRREQLFGWLAADYGLATVRFHSRGSGNSAGDAANMTLDTMEEDALIVASQAVDRLGTQLVGFVGARLGAVVAHRAALNYPGAAVVWWQPVVEAESYVRELFRARMIGSLKAGVKTKNSDLKALLQSEGVLDVLGYPVTLRFHDSLFSRPLDDAPQGPRNGLVVQMSRNSELHPRLEVFVSKLRDNGWKVDTLAIADEETWWFGARGRAGELEIRSVAMGMIPVSVGFFRSNIV